MNKKNNFSKTFIHFSCLHKTKPKAQNIAKKYQLLSLEHVWERAASPDLR